MDMRKLLLSGAAAYCLVSGVSADTSYNFSAIIALVEALSPLIYAVAGLGIPILALITVFLGIYLARNIIYSVVKLVEDAVGSAMKFE